MYRLCSLATSTICLKAFSLKTKPVGLFGLIKQIATVFEVISNNGEFLGGSIFPGLEVASKALASKASLLSEINFDEWSKNQKVLGNNTDEALKSSIYWGYISLTEGIIKRIIKELKLNKKEYIIIGTGGFAEIINRQIPIFDRIDQNLTLDGMRIIYNLNKK